MGFRLEDLQGTTLVHSHREGRPSANNHFAISNYCWATDLRLLKRYAETGQIVPYEEPDNRLRWGVPGQLPNRGVIFL